MTMTWTQQMPTVPGWYWNRDMHDKSDEPECVHVRDCAGKLAIGNSYIAGWKSLWERYEWAGPIPVPTCSATLPRNGGYCPKCRRTMHTRTRILVAHVPDADHIFCTWCGARLDIMPRAEGQHER